MDSSHIIYAGMSHVLNEIKNKVS